MFNCDGLIYCKCAKFIIIKLNINIIQIATKKKLEEIHLHNTSTKFMVNKSLNEQYMYPNVVQFHYEL